MPGLDPALLELKGARAETRYVALITLKFFAGLMTQRSPFASIDTRYGSRFLGGKPDALITGSNVEVSNSLTLQRRPGLLPFGPSIPAPLAFYAFKQVLPANTQIIVDTATAVYNYSSTSAGLLFFKGPGAGQTNFAQQGNTLYFTNGVDLLKLVGPNLLTQSNAFNVAANWTAANATLLAGQFDPNGTLTATRITWGVATSAAFIQQAVAPNLTPVVSNTFTASVWARAVSGAPTVTLFLQDQAGANVSSQVITLNQTWTRYQVTGTLGAGSTQAVLRLGTPSTTAIAIQVYGAQLEVGGPATPTQVTTAQPQGIYNWGIVGPTAAPGVTSAPVEPRWQAATAYVVGQSAADSNGNKEVVTVAGTTGATEPMWPVTKNSTTVDGTVTWKQVGPDGLTARTNYQWGYAFENRLTGHLSNLSPLSASTMTLANNLAVTYTITGTGSTDPQVSRIAVFRNADGGAFWFLAGTLPNPAGGLGWSFLDVTQDLDLNAQIFAPIGLLNTPPPAGAIAPTWHQSRMWLMVGSTLFFSSGPDNAALLNILQDGVIPESFAPANFIQFDQPGVRLQPTAAGMLVLTVGDLWLVTGSDLASFNPVRVLAGHGIRSFNALDIDGSSIWIYTTDRQFLVINASSGSLEMGFPVGDTLAASFDPVKVYVARHVAGSLDNACFVADGSTGWFRVNPNQVGASTAGEPSPVWSPKATITGGAQAIASLETSPGLHQLLVGRVASGGGTQVLGQLTGTGVNDLSVGTAWTNPSNVTLDNPISVATVTLNVQAATSGSDVVNTGSGAGTAVSAGSVTTGFANEIAFTGIEGDLITTGGGGGFGGGGGGGGDRLLPIIL